MFEDKGQDSPLGRAESQADADFAGTPVHDVGDEAVDAYGADSYGERAEAKQQNGERPRRGDG